MRSHERFLVDLDGSVWSAASRVVFGMGVVPVMRALWGGGDSIWITIASFIGVLVALRIGFALLRRFLPFSAEAKEIWAARRNVSKQHDSYFWQKLFWMGLGMLPHSVVGEGLRTGEMALLLVCLVGGGAGLFCWRRARELSSAMLPKPRSAE
jgi:hypothetical protein